RLLNAHVDVHVGMVSARVVVQRILDKLKTGQADRIEGQVIGAAGVADGERIHTEVVERFHPGGEDGGHHFIALEIDAADFAGAIVNVVVGVELGMFRRRLHYFGIGEMLLDVGAGAEQALFFAGPEADANVVFAGDGDARRSWRVFLLIAAASLLNEYGSVVAARRLDPSGNAFFDEKLLYFQTQFALGAKLRGAIFCRRNGDRLRRKLRQLGIGVAMRLRLEAFGIVGD